MSAKVGAGRGRSVRNTQDGTIYITYIAVKMARQSARLDIGLAGNHQYYPVCIDPGFVAWGQIMFAYSSVSSWKGKYC